MSKDTGYPGDNDPLDVCEIGIRQIGTGQVRAVKVLGVLAMIDDDETDWKVVVGVEIESASPRHRAANAPRNFDFHTGCGLSMWTTGGLRNSMMWTMWSQETISLIRRAVRTRQDPRRQAAQ